MRRTTPFLWRAVAWFCAGLAVNALYALLALAYAESTGGRELDAIFIEPITGEAKGLQLFGVTGGLNIYRSNGLALDPNHLGIMLLVPLLLLLPVYLKLPSKSRLRIPLAALLALLFVVDLATLSRSALLGLGVGLVVLAVPYRRLLVSGRFLVPLAVLAGLLAVVVAQRSNFFEGVLRVRTNVESSSTRTHFELYDLLAPVLRETPLFGLGKNTFAVYYEFLTGKSDWGPHSYYVSVVTETGLVGAALVAAYLVYVFQRLSVARGLGRSLVDRRGHGRGAAALARLGNHGRRRRDAGGELLLPDHADVLLHRARGARAHRSASPSAPRAFAHEDRRLHDLVSASP